MRPPSPAEPNAHLHPPHRHGCRRAPSPGEEPEPPGHGPGTLPQGRQVGTALPHGSPGFISRISVARYEVECSSAHRTGRKEERDLPRHRRSLEGAAGPAAMAAAPTREGRESGGGGRRCRRAAGCATTRRARFVRLPTALAKAAPAWPEGPRLTNAVPRLTPRPPPLRTPAPTGLPVESEFPPARLRKRQGGARCLRQAEAKDMPCETQGLPAGNPPPPRLQQPAAATPCSNCSLRAPGVRSRGKAICLGAPREGRREGRTEDAPAGSTQTLRFTAWLVIFLIKSKAFAGVSKGLPLPAFHPSISSSRTRPRSGQVDGRRSRSYPRPSWALTPRSQPAPCPPASTQPRRERRRSSHRPVRASAGAGGGGRRRSGGAAGAEAAAGESLPSPLAALPFAPHLIRRKGRERRRAIIEEKVERRGGGGGKRHERCLRSNPPPPGAAAGAGQVRGEAGPGAAPAAEGGGVVPGQPYMAGAVLVGVLFLLALLPFNSFSSPRSYAVRSVLNDLEGACSAVRLGARVSSRAGYCGVRSNDSSGKYLY